MAFTADYEQLALIFHGGAGVRGHWPNLLLSEALGAPRLIPAGLEPISFGANLNCPLRLTHREGETVLEVHAKRDLTGTIPRVLCRLWAGQGAKCRVIDRRYRRSKVGMVQHIGKR